MRLHLGTASLRGDIAKYARHFDLLELRAEKGKLPRAQRLAEMAKAVPDGFVFSIVMPRAVSNLESGPNADQELAYALEVAQTLNAGWLVLCTESNVMPSARTRRALAAFVERLPPGPRRAWEPRGVWEIEDAMALADELGLCLVTDASREPAPPGDVLYTRLRALGRSRISTSGLENVAEELESFEEGYVIIEGDAAAQAARTLRALCVGSPVDDDAEEELSTP